MLLDHDQIIIMIYRDRTTNDELRISQKKKNSCFTKIEVYFLED